MSTGQNHIPAGQSLDHAPLIGPGFDDRRDPDNQRKSSGFERRQFTNSLSEYSDDAAELGKAIDQYKLIHRRRFINYEELLSVVKSLGYQKPTS